MGLELGLGSVIRFGVSICKHIQGAAKKVDP